ncbi:sulfhydryl oxidase 2-like isoform X6 [Diospyros lotus]|uniref:sulfhydryl oxidase 2-like isoform X6 n=1 Tax=Diospyros lotus TaxID=55363 RepID=UPI00224DB0ED|nr:sulfhydryl oxidase 2-like isoform X6 [Diospyros lotus]
MSSSSSLLVLPFLFLISEALDLSSVASVGSRSILRAVVVNSGDQPDFAVELNASNFDAVLRETPATYAVVEFFAHWCPACRNYKPHYEKVARLFNGPDAAHPGIILMTRVDCASKINNELCNKFSVGHYPMLLWGPPSKFVAAGWKPKQDKSEIRTIDDGRTSDHLLNWINKQMGSSYGLDDEKYENEHLQSNVSDPGQIVQAIYDAEEATSTAFSIILVQKQMIKLETRASLIKFLQLLVAHHPSGRCRKGSAEFLVNFDELYPADSFSAIKQENIIVKGKGSLGSFPICGKEVPRGYWMFCRGSRNGTRGFRTYHWGRQLAVLRNARDYYFDDAHMKGILNSRGGVGKQTDSETLVYSRRPKSKPNETLASEAPKEFELVIAPTTHETKPNPDQVKNLDDLPITLRKKPRSCTLHPISKFVSYNALCAKCCAFTSNLDRIQIPKNIQEALEIPEWRELVMEEISALEKNGTWEG